MSDLSLQEQALKGGDAWVKCEGMDDKQAKEELKKLRALIAQGSVFSAKVTEDNYPRWFRESDSGKTLTKEDYLKYCNLVGPRGYTFDQAIQCGIDGASQTGMAIPDEESYHLWRGWYDKMIEVRHNFPAGKDHVTDLDYSKIDTSKVPKDLNDFCVSTRIRAARNISGFGLPPGTTRSERRQVEAIVKEGLATLTGELEGKYYSLAGMTPEEEAQLQADHFLFQKPNVKAMISSSGGCRDWPDARGIFHNKDKTFLVWVNEEDQMRVISMAPGGDVSAVFKLWVDGVNAVAKVVEGKGMKFMYDKHAGMLSSCVSNLGTGLRASMHIKLPGILKVVGQDGLDKWCETKNMQCRGTGGEHTEASSDGKVDISNCERLGKSEVQLVQLMVDGCCELISLEKRCTAGEGDAVKKEMEEAVKNHK
jgi:creatine kinase